MANINKIRLSGTTYDVQDPNATKVVSLTQAQYDALATKDPNVLYNITDAQAADLSNYYTKSETSGATEISTALADKANTATTYTKTEVDNAITAATDDMATETWVENQGYLTQHQDLSNYALKSEIPDISGKQDTLVSGTNIKTINNESILGSGNISIEGGGGMDDNTQKLIATSLVDLNDRKADKTSLSKYQPKGDYATKSQLDTKANASDVMTLAKSEENEKITAFALNNLNNKFGGLSFVKTTESEYAALSAKDENTLYIVVADPS